MGPALGEVGGPDMASALRVSALWPQTDARPVAEPEPTLLRLLLRDLEPFPSPDLLGSPMSWTVERGCDRPAAVATVSPASATRSATSATLLRSPTRRPAPRRAMLPEHAAGEQLRDPELVPDMIDAAPVAGGARTSPEAASRRSASRASGRRPPCAAAPSPLGSNQWRLNGSILLELLQPPRVAGLQAA